MSTVEVSDSSMLNKAKLFSETSALNRGRYYPARARVTLISPHTFARARKKVNKVASTEAKAMNLPAVNGDFTDAL
jgi:hypothetical protein